MSIGISDLTLLVARLLFASIFEGVIVVALVWCALRALPNFGAASRYLVWFCALVALAIVPLFSVWNVALPTIQTRSSTWTPLALPVMSSLVAPSRTIASNALPILDAKRDSGGLSKSTRFAFPISSNVALTVAALWLLVAIGRLLILAFDVRQLSTLRRRARPWSETHRYPVLSSPDVSVPLAAGFTRPTIILPTSMIELSDEHSLRSILIHEVAHLRRYDIWTNAIARVIHAFLACNPIAWFVLQRLALEREIACDDWVVAQTGSGDRFARTLAALAARKIQRVPSLARSAFGSPHAIVVRIERLLDARPRRLRPSPFALGGAIMLLAILALTLQTLTPVLAFAPEQSVTTPESASTGACPVPNRGVIVKSVLTKSFAKETNGDDLGAYYKTYLAAHPGSKMIDIQLTVNASGAPSNTIIKSGPAVPANMIKSLMHTYAQSTFLPALHDCVPVASTVYFDIPISTNDGPNAASLIVPNYPPGWSAAHSCKIPTVTRARFRRGFDPRTAYTAMLPWFPASMPTIPVNTAIETVVRVETTADGTATAARIVRPSGHPEFDATTRTAALGATYPLTESTCPGPPAYTWTTRYSNVAPIGMLVRTTIEPHAR